MSYSTSRLIFFSVFIGIVLIFTGKTIQQLVHYGRLNQTTPVQDVQWAILSNQADSFAPHAVYTFLVDGKVYQGKTTWYKKYLNQWTAEEAIHRLPEELHVWYDSSSPSFSSLEKFFPVKNFFYMVTLWLLVFYFWGLSRYIAKKT